MEPTLWWGHGFGFMWLVPLIFFVVCVFFMRGMFSRGGCGMHDDKTRHKDSAREILDKRFTRGEITKEEYEEMKQSLGNDAPG